MRVAFACADNRQGTIKSMSAHSGQRDRARHLELVGVDDEAAEPEAGPPRRAHRDRLAAGPEQRGAAPLLLGAGDDVSVVIELAIAARSQPAQVLVGQATARVADVEDEGRVGARVL